MEREEFLDDIHLRVLRVTEELRAIQQELNCAAMEAPGDPELMEALSQQPEMQVINNESEAGDTLRESIRHKTAEDVVISPEAAFLKKCRAAADTALLRHFADGKSRKPN